MMVGGYLAIFVGGGLGSAFRHLVNRASLAYFGPAFPYGTLIVNVVGGLLMGVLAELRFRPNPKIGRPTGWCLHEPELH